MSDCSGKEAGALRLGRDRITTTTTIEREWLDQIIAGTKKIE